MRQILFINSIPGDILGGGELWNIKVAQYLSSIGDGIILVTRQNSILAEQFKKISKDHYELDFSFDFNPFSINKIYKLIKKHHVTHIICNFNKDVSIAGSAARKFDKTIKVIFRNGFPILHKKWKHKLLLPYFDSIITNSKKIADQYNTYGWDLGRKTHVIYNGIDIKHEYDVPTFKVNEPLTIFGAGRLTNLKRFDLFIDVISELNKRGIKTHAVLAGSGPELDSLKKQTDKLKLDITFLGHVDNLSTHLQSTDILLHCSENEGMPNIIMESMLIGKPFVTSNAGATDELVTDGIDGNIVHIQDPIIYADRIESLLNDPEFVNRQISQAHDKIVNHFSFKRSMTQFLQVLDY